MRNVKIITLRLLCWVFGHDWKTTRMVNRTKAIWMGHIGGSFAGTDADCQRCGYEWRDFDGFGLTREMVQKDPEKYRVSDVAQPDNQSVTEAEASESRKK